MMVGARAEGPSAVRRWLARALASELAAFVVPGREMLDVLGLDAAAAGLRVVASSRHANVLLLVGEIPPGLARAAATVYAQVPRPRSVLVLGTSSPAPLPDADFVVEAVHTDLVRGVTELRRRMAAEAWHADAAAFELPEAAPGPAERSHEDMGTVHHDIADVESGEMAGMDQGMPGMEHGGTHHEMHSSGGFMSMVAMTRDLPRSADGLPMEWLDVPFGPLFPGLPGGLDLVLTLDGDTVTRAQLSHETLKRQLPDFWPGDADGFADRLARLDPLAGTAYWLLGCRALERASGHECAEDEARRRVAALERERAASHLNWLGRFGFLLGIDWLARRASALARAVRVAEDAARLPALRADVAAFARQVQRTPLLSRRLAAVGRIEPARQVTGPVARACGQEIDARSDDPAYVQLGFQPIVEQAGDASARLWVRLAEVEQSLQIMSEAGSPGRISPPSIPRVSGAGRAEIETPRGAASLTLTLVHGQVTHVRVDTPSMRLAALVEPVTRDRELAGALLGVASLDLSPWELAQ
jgi:Ni,Fe-hydrogenase III large subunit